MLEANADLDYIRFAPRPLKWRSRLPGQTMSQMSVGRRAAIRQQLLDIYGNGTVAPCMIPLDLDECLRIVDICTINVDHYPLPVSRGGLAVVENLRPACRPCNRLLGRWWGDYLRSISATGILAR